MKYERCLNKKKSIIKKKLRKKNSCVSPFLLQARVRHTIKEKYYTIYTHNFPDLIDTCIATCHLSSCEST